MPQFPKRFPGFDRHAGKASSISTDERLSLTNTVLFFSTSGRVVRNFLVISRPSHLSVGKVVARRLQHCRLEGQSCRFPSSSKLDLATNQGETSNVGQSFIVFAGHDDGWPHVTLLRRDTLRPYSRQRHRRFVPLFLVQPTGPEDAKRGQPTNMK